MNISMVKSIRLIHTVPPTKANEKRTMSNQDRAENYRMNKEYCLKLIRGGERDLDKIKDLVGVKWLTLRKYLKALHEEGFIIFICKYGETTIIEKAL